MQQNSKTDRPRSPSSGENINAYQEPAPEARPSDPLLAHPEPSIKSVSEKPAPEPNPDGAPKRRLPTALSSLRHRNYQLWFGGQLISVIGTWMQIVAQSWLVYQISHSELALGMVGFASSIPVLFVSPWGGVVTDLVPKRTLLVITQATSMILAFILSALVFTNTVQVWHILTLSAVLGFVNAFDAPARQAMVVDMVGKEDLSNAIALNSTIFNGARVVGPAIGGGLLAAVGAGWCFLVNGISFLAVIAGLLSMRFPPMPVRQTTAKPWRQFLEGYHYAVGRREIFSLLMLAAIFSIFGTAYSSILPAFVDLALHSNAAGYGTINAAVGAGAVTGALYIAQFGNRSRRGMILMLANFAYPIVLIGFAFATNFNLALLLAYLLGLGFMLLFNNVNSLLQMGVSDEMRGRVMSLYTLAFFGFSPLGTLGIGAVAERIPINITIAASAVLTLLFSILVYMRSPEIRKLK